MPRIERLWERASWIRRSGLQDGSRRVWSARVPPMINAARARKARQIIGEKGNDFLRIIIQTSIVQDVQIYVARIHLLDQAHAHVECLRVRDNGLNIIGRAVVPIEPRKFQTASSYPRDNSEWVSKVLEVQQWNPRRHGWPDVRQASEVSNIEAFQCWMAKKEICQRVFPFYGSPPVLRNTHGALDQTGKGATENRPQWWLVSHCSWMVLSLERTLQFGSEWSRLELDIVVDDFLLTVHCPKHTSKAPVQYGGHEMGKEH
ncbi:hypothetical protein B0H17DRAFT_1136363 [Mycena rosella]|uniref:Uncharacterized protein n=1 Tax=Mycena rosella TaxID=1033263 RepID=A0AAD7GG33_MYCRO|nr:hypothetical protein B0H17DRAFT_1136363 [Mycena rosella]